MNIQNKVLEYFSSSIKALPFAKWAKPKQTELNLKRTRTLGENSEVIWDIGADGAKVSDHIEMAGYYVSAIISYGSDENGELRLMRHITVPMLRLKPNLTASSFSHNFTSDSFTVTQNSKKIVETPDKVIIKGSLKIISHSSCDTEITRELLPAVNKPALIEKVTVKALFSERLYKNGMMKSTSANETTWDRSLLFALRGVFLAGKAETGIKETLNYCRNRLLGSHCPYPFEAFPEGNRAHLAAESLLFARIITEGLFGLRAVGLKKLRIKPQLSEDCGEISLQNIKLFSKCFDITTCKDGIRVSFDGETYKTESLNAVFDFNTCCFEKTELIL